MNVHRVVTTRLGVLMALVLVAAYGVLIYHLGVTHYDKRIQRGTARTTAQAVQKGAGTSEISGTANGGIDGNTEAKELLPGAGAAGNGTISTGSTDRPKEPGNTAGVQETGSPAKLSSRGGTRNDDRLDTGLADSGSAGSGDVAVAAWAERFAQEGEDYIITAYTAGAESTGKEPDDDGYGQPAISGTKYVDFQPIYCQEQHTVAADWRILPPGTIIRIEGVDADLVVEDRGGAVKGKHIDYYIPDLAAAKAWGVQRRKVVILKLGGV